MKYIIRRGECENPVKFFPKKKRNTRNLFIAREINWIKSYEMKLDDKRAKLDKIKSYKA
jgi:hypothetical protein